MGIGVLAAVAVLLNASGYRHVYPVGGQFEFTQLEAPLRAVEVADPASLVGDEESLVGEAASVIAGEGVPNTDDDARMRPRRAPVGIVRKALTALDELGSAHTQRNLSFVRRGWEHDVPQAWDDANMGVPSVVTHRLMSFAGRPVYSNVPHDSGGGRAADVLAGAKDLYAHLVGFKDQRAAELYVQREPSPVSGDNRRARSLHAILGDLELLPEPPALLSGVGLGVIESRGSSFGAHLGGQPSAAGINNSGPETHKARDVQPDLPDGDIYGVLIGARRAHPRNQGLAMFVVGLLAIGLGGLLGHFAADADGLRTRPEEDEAASRHHDDDTKRHSES